MPRNWYGLTVSRNSGAQMMREGASITTEMGGDGTNSATDLAQAFAGEGTKCVAAGMTWRVTRRGIDLAASKAMEAIKSQR